MATEAYDTIREPDPTLGTAGETLKQARSLQRIAESRKPSSGRTDP